MAGVSCHAIRVSFTGDLGWELHCAEADQAKLYAALLEAGATHGAGPVGSRALMSLRVEKGYGSWGRDYSPEYWPQELGLEGLIKPGGGFLNADQAYANLLKPAREKLVMLELDAAATEVSQADATGGEPVFCKGEGIGKVSSGAYGYSVGKSLALAFVRAEIAAGTEVEVMVLGQPHPAVVLDAPPFDPKGLRLRG